MRKFWMVKNVQGGASNIMHETKEEAIEEAKRLCANMNNSPNEVAILEVIKAYRRKPVKIKKLKIEDPA